MNFNLRSKLYMGFLGHVIGLMFIVGVAAVGAQDNRSKQKGLDALPEVKALPPEGKRAALIIGINDYEDTQITRLQGAVHDAKDLKDALITHAGFRDEGIILLTSDSADPSYRPNARNIYNWLDKLKGLVQKDGLLVFAFSGHGISSNDGQAFLLPSDASMTTDIIRLKKFAVAVTDVADYVKNTGVRQMIMLLDACRNNPKGKGDGDNSTALKEGFTKPFDFQKRNGDIDALVTIYATQPGERAWENRKTNHGYFMEAVIEAINGAASDSVTGEVTLELFRRYVEDNVYNRTLRESERPQKPRFLADGYNGDLVIARGVPSDPDAPARNAWERIQYAGTRADYDSFLKKFPTSKFGEFAYWEMIRSSADRTDFKTYMSKYPKGKHYSEAVNRAEQLLWQQAKNSQQPKDYQAYLKEYPNGDYADSAKLKLSPPETRPVSEQVTSKPLNAMLLVLTNPPKANIVVRVRDSKAKIQEGPSDANGKFRANLPLGTYDIEVSAAKHDARRIDSFKLDAGSEPLQVELTPLTGAILIGPVDSEATVFLNEQKQTELRRNSKEKQIEISDVPIGHYRIRVAQKQQTNTKDMFGKPRPTPEAVVEREIDVLGGRQVFVATEFKATSTTGTLSIAVNPTTARVIVKSKTTSFREEVLATSEPRFELSPGDYDVEVIAARYRTWKQSVTITGGDLKALPVTLEPDVVQVTIKGPANASIYFDRAPKGTITATGELILPGIIPGSHHIEASMAGFNKFSVNRDFTANETLNIKLTPLVVDASPWSERFESLEYWDAPRSWSLGWNGQKNVIISGTDVGLGKRSNYGNFELEFNINIIKGKQAAWVVRATDTGNYYLFVLEKAKDRARLYAYTSKDGELSPRRSLGEFSGELPDQLHVFITATGKDIKTELDLPEGRQFMGVFSGAQDLPIGRIGFRAFADGDQFVVLDLQCRPKS
jgi:uncharacterized caspase-like protein